MTLFMAMQNSGRTDDAALVLIPDRFNWWAFLFAPVWVLFRGLWRVFALLAAISISLVLLSSFLILPLAALYGVGALWLGFEASNLLARNLHRRGWKRAGELIASNLEEAEALYLLRAHSSPSVSARLKA